MYYKIVFSDGRRPRYGVHRRGSQTLASEIDALVGESLHTNGVPLMLEIDGRGDDNATPGDCFETEQGFSVLALSEKEYRMETGQDDIPTTQLT